MEIIIAVQEDFPAPITGGDLSKFLKKISSKTYENTGIDPMTGWSQLRPRSITFYDLTIPEKATEEALIDLAPYFGGKLMKFTKLYDVPILGKAIQSALGIKAIDHDKYSKLAQERGISRKTESVRLVVLGLIEDDHDELGREML